MVVASHLVLGDISLVVLAVHVTFYKRDRTS